MIDALLHALNMSFVMGWVILWPLILGFALSGAIQAVVSHAQMSKLLPDAKAKTLVIASLLGAASSSCSYAAVALARSIFRKGASFMAAMAFEIASTNLVIELGIIMLVLLGWQFALAEFIGGPIMIIVLALIFKRFLSPKMEKMALKQANKDVSGRMEGHAMMSEMSASQSGNIWQRLISKEGRTATSHYFVMDWASVWIDIVGGILIAGAIAAWVPTSFFQNFFFSSHPTISVIWGPLVGPLIAVISFVCSVGNIPLAVVLWNGGISFGGVIAFIFADLIVLPILRIYKKYYGTKIAVFLFVSFYIAMAVAGYVVELLFALLEITPSNRSLALFENGISLNYTSVLNVIFIVVGVLLVSRFLRTGGLKMLAHMKAH